MRTEKDILKDFQTTLVTRTSKITSFEPNGVISAIGAAISRVLAELEYRINRGIRGLFTTTANGDSLANLGYERFGLEPLTASASSVIIVFTGTTGTVIPVDTQVKSSTGIIFETSKALTLGQKNPDIQAAKGTIIGDSVLAISTTAGSNTKVPANSIQEFVTPIDGVSLNNPLPAEGGDDGESDNEFAERIRNHVGILNQGTGLFYKAAAQAADPNVLRVNVRQGGYFGVIVDVVHRSGGTFEPSDLTDIRDYIADLRQIEVKITVQNLTFTDISVVAAVRMKSGYTLDQVYTAIAENLVEFINWKTWKFGDPVYSSDLFAIVNNSDGVEYLATSSFLPKTTQISVSKASLPRLKSLAVTDLATGTSKNLAEIKQEHF